MNRLRGIVAAVGLCAGLLINTAPAVAADAKGGDAKPPAKDLVLKGDAKCTTCHDEADSPEALAIGKTKHGTRADQRTPSCTSCHGESVKHEKEAGRGTGKGPAPDFAFGKKTKNSAEERNQQCLNCHQGGKRIHWQSGVHANRDVTCASCHKIHDGHDKVRSKEAQTEVCFNCHKEQRNQATRPSHHPVIEGKMTCSSCHDVHSDNPKMMARGTTNDTCYTCHMEKRGPFLHSHQPVTEDCAICHNPHGTTAANLLKTRMPFLCQSCHDGSGHHGQTASLPPSSRANNTGFSALGTVGRGCTNCHTNIHGSNSTENATAGTRFTR